jgi:hypothetical protein
MREELQETSVDALFRGEAERLLKRPKAEEELQKICKSERGAGRLRVMAHEMLLMMGKNPDPKMVRVYCESVAGDFMHNWWALPGDHLEKLGESLVQFGESAIPHLLKEIDNSDQLTYLGPDAPTCRAKGYTVADLIGYLACQILDLPFPDADTFEERRPGLNKLQNELTERVAAEKRK